MPMHLVLERPAMAISFRVPSRDRESAKSRGINQFENPSVHPLLRQQDHIMRIPQPAPYCEMRPVLARADRRIASILRRHQTFSVSHYMSNVERMIRDEVAWDRLPDRRNREGPAVAGRRSRRIPAWLWHEKPLE